MSLISKHVSFEIITRSLENITKMWFNSKRVECPRTSKIKRHRIETLKHSYSFSIFFFNNKAPNYTLKWSKDKIRLEKTISKKHIVLDMAKHQQQFRDL